MPPEKNAFDTYAAEMADRFEAFASWAIENWPAKSLPLQASDFDLARQQIHVLLGERLQHAQSAHGAAASKDSPDSRQALDPAAGGAQYVNVNPTPWP